MLAVLVFVEKCKVSQDGVFEVCEGLVHSKEQHLSRCGGGVLGLGGVLKPTLEHHGDEREGSSAHPSGGPATVMFLLREGQEAAGRGGGSCRETSHASIYWGGGSFGGTAMASSYGGSRT